MSGPDFVDFADFRTAFPSFFPTAGEKSFSVPAHLGARLQLNTHLASLPLSFNRQDDDVTHPTIIHLCQEASNTANGLPVYRCD